MMRLALDLLAPEVPLLGLSPPPLPLPRAGRLRLSLPPLLRCRFQSPFPAILYQRDNRTMGLPAALPRSCQSHRPSSKGGWTPGWGFRCWQPARDFQGEM